MHDGWQLMLNGMQIIDFKNYTSTRGKNKMCIQIVKDIHKARKGGHKFGIEEMKTLAEKFLESVKYDGKGAVPIIKIAQECGFKVIWGSMIDKEMSGFISIDEQNADEFESDKIIGVNKDDELGHQRFVIAHELAHYLFDYDVTAMMPYFDTYMKNSHKSSKEQIANMFAANLLMPAQNFVLKFDEDKTMKENIKYWAEYFAVQEKAARKRVKEVMDSGI